ncbi:rhodanese-like domain-containing protein [Facklamia miroungae]|uniref:Rhodanese-related sulfurtransferase n=1 Tax=Facklamia miroungae TaxID=120956 RepID=A0A1G7QND9_9LACT|nr:rhodanese-like domain-containing protein [Facklamia miroungae]NKZ29005.1 rhodanese-like domain-containing protein [Facklamia miroungae]SDG00008.1 Rhodanese-related sulfurtransferase [Facklamia miroungae]
MMKVLSKISKFTIVLLSTLMISVSTIYAQTEIMPGQELERIQLDKKAKEKYLVIDVRPEEQYEKGHLSHAINIPLEDLGNELDRLEDYKEMPIIVYCNTGKKSAEAATLLLDKGFKDVKDAQGVKEFEYTLVTYESILPDEFIEEAKDKETLFIDARDAKDFEKASVEGAINASVDNPEAVLEQLPEDKTAKIITFCYSGNKSADIANFLEEHGYTNVKNSLDGTKENENLPLVEKAS